MSEDLRDKITTAIDREEALARRAYDAEPGPWALHHNATRYGRADEWEIRDYGGDSLAWVGTENDARLILAAASPDVVLRRCAADRRVLDLIDSARIKAARIDARERNKPNNASADPEASHELRLYAAALETIVADAWGIEPADEEDE